MDTPIDTAEIRADLEQIVREADAIAAAAAAAQDDEIDNEVDDSSDSDTDREEALVEAAAERRIEALAALERLDSGTYGTCIDCSTTIVQDRLAFRPEAARCLSCQEAFEAL
ncbi:MAG: transcriptional regulator, TraR/DksA family [Frankiales bacterium]|nr:transcriptional regulator, TraR/DksA family [Frankiales bacterium]